MKNRIIKIISFILAAAMLSGVLCACAQNVLPIDSKNTTGREENPDKRPIDAEPVSATDLMAGVTSEDSKGTDPDDAFIKTQLDFAFRLFKSSAKQDDKNLMVSPLSVMLALAMTANGADGNTLKEMERVLGGSIPLTDLNKYLKNYVSSLRSNEKTSIKFADSIWFRDNEDEFRVNEDFLKINADYYKASAYRAPFDDRTLKDINNWVYSNTDGLIDKVLDSIPKEAIMYLINTIVFDGKWSEEIRTETNTSEKFTNSEGTEREAEMLHSTESVYFNDGKATGFMKNYYGNYAFVALLPNEGVSIDEYVQSLNSESYMNMFKNREYGKVVCKFPKFKSDYNTELSSILIEMGIRDAFSGENADFSKIGSVNPGENICISKVIHKTHIEVDNAGTKAAAVTVIEMVKATSIGPEETKYYYVTLDRPFVYMIIDTQTNLPIFIGQVKDIT